MSARRAVMSDPVANETTVMPQTVHPLIFQRLAPRPLANVIAATAVKAGIFRRVRDAYRTFFNNVSKISCTFMSRVLSFLKLIRIILGAGSVQPLPRKLAERCHQISPPKPHGANERRALLAVAHGMIGRQRRPARVTHGDARSSRHCFKHNLHTRALTRGKIHSPQFKLELPGGLPDRDPSPREHPRS